MLVEADSRRKWEIGAHADEHPAPTRIVDVEVVLNDPALCHLQMPTVILFVPIGDPDSAWFARSQDSDYGIGLGSFEEGMEEIIPATLGRFHYWHAPLQRAIRHPILELLG